MPRLSNKRREGRLEEDKNFPNTWKTTACRGTVIVDRDAGSFSMVYAEEIDNKHAVIEALKIVLEAARCSSAKFNMFPAMLEQEIKELENG